MPCISEKLGAYSEIPRTSFSLERNHWSIGLCAAPPPLPPLPCYILRVMYCLLAGGPLSENCAQPKKQTFSKKNGRATHRVLGPVWPSKKGPFSIYSNEIGFNFIPCCSYKIQTKLWIPKTLIFNIFRNNFFSVLKNHRWVTASAKIKQSIQL